MKNVVFQSALMLIAAVCSCSSIGMRLNDRTNDGVHHIRYYRFDPASDIASRIKPIPPVYLAMLKEWDNRSDYESYQPTNEELRLFNEYMGYLPAFNRKTMQASTVAVYFIKNFTGAGMADFAVGDKNEVYTILCINPDVMKKTISEWLVFRELSSFKKTDADIQLSIDCGSRYKALLYLLAHESSHIVDYVHHMTPYIDTFSAEIFGEKKDAVAFISGVWDDYARPVASYAVKDRDKISSYGMTPAVLLDTEIVPMYESLGRTPFVSLYGCRVWVEDFAESSTFYFLTQVMKQPYTVTVYQKGKKIYEYKPEENPLAAARWKHLQILYEK